MLLRLHAIPFFYLVSSDPRRGDLMELFNDGIRIMIHMITAGENE